MKPSSFWNPPTPRTDNTRLCGPFSCKDSPVPRPPCGLATPRAVFACWSTGSATAPIAVAEKEILVTFQKRAHNPLLMAADFHKTDLAIPWLGRKHLRFVFG
jgi:hypothetical protein